MYETMPDHNLPEELVQFRDSIRRFVDRELRPLEKQVALEGKLPDEALAAITAKAKAAGFWMLEAPQELGGADLGLLPLAIFWEELARTTAIPSRDHTMF